MVFTFAGTIASFIDDDWNLVERMINFYHIQDKEHEGQWAAKAFVNTAAERGGLDKMSITCLGSRISDPNRYHLHFLALCMDNASVCDVIARSAGVMLLKKYGVKFHEENARIRCMAHVVNLIVQSLLAALDEANDPDLDDYYIPNKHLPFHYDPEDDEEVAEMECEGEEKENDDADDADDEFVELLHLDLGDEALEDELEDELNETVDLSEVKKVSPRAYYVVFNTHLPQLRAITKKICSSPQRRKQFRNFAKQAYGSKPAPAPSNKLLCDLMVIRDVVTRWNYTHAMIKRALMLRKVRSWLWFVFVLSSPLMMCFREGR